MIEGRPVAMVERMSLGQRVVHGVLLLAILMLVVSGLALAYHQHGWAQALIRLMGGLDGRLAVHRAGALLLLALGVYHAAGLAFSARYRRGMRESVPRGSDLKGAWAAFLYRTTGKGEPPRHGHFTPMQKFQYWGILLGSLAMGVSGAVLWSPRASLEVFPKSFIDLMLVVHSSQAQLIFILFIAWHLYDIHLAGGNFPMNPAWLTGRMREDAFKAQHLAEWESLRKGERE
jgi:cytochrome b subunit of formate dehydrogenase